MVICQLAATTIAAVTAAGCAPVVGGLEEVHADLRTMEAHWTFLSDDLLLGRDTLSPEYEIAARYVASVFAGLGLDPAGDAGSYYQAVPYRQYRVDPAGVRAVLHRDQKSDTELEWAAEFVMSGNPVREETSVRAPVVFVGHGIAAPALGHDDYAAVDVEGKIVLLLSGAPASFPADQRAYYSSGRTKREAAVERGAVGAISVFSAERARRVPWERVARRAGRPSLRWLAADGNVNDYAPELAGRAALSHAAARKLFEGSGRRFDRVLEQADEGEYESFDLATEVTLESRTTHEDAAASNVVALLPGADPELRKEYVVFTAHLDHIGVGPEVDGDAIYNGAYDNAMGVAVLLEVARRLVQEGPTQRSLLFVAVGGEEKGLLGSDYFAHYPTVEDGPMVANINIDMPLFLFPLRDLIAFGAEHSSLEGNVARATAAVGLEVTPDPAPEEVIFVRSDQYSFVRQGVPAVFLVPGRGSRDAAVDGDAQWREFLASHYHKPSDDLSRPVDWESAAQFVEVNVRLGRDIADADAPPTWNPGDFFGERFGR